MKRTIKITGWIGLLASMLMFAGDMLLYFTTESFVDFEKELLPSMGNVSFERLAAGGILGPLTACLYMIGFYHIYLSIKEPRKTLAKIVFVALSVSIIFGGAYHAFFPAYGIVGAEGHPEIIEHLMHYVEVLGFFTFIPMVLGWILFCYLILRKKTMYPRLFVLLTPMITIWLSGIWINLPQPYLIIIGGGWNNLVLTIFFTASLIVLSRCNKKLNSSTPKSNELLIG